MRELLVINDVHLGVSRVSGATPLLAEKLRADLQTDLRALLMDHTDKDLLFNGDIFDAFDVPMGDALAFIHTVGEWLEHTADQSKLCEMNDVTLGCGNHDISKDSSRLSMFDFVASMLQWRYPKNVRVVTKPTDLGHGMWMIPHATNQEIFDMQLKAAAAELTKPHFIFLHANYDNHFAVEQDHSLNVSAEQAKVLTDQGHTLVFGHEHQARIFEGIVITGNQWPSSVADCLNNNTKRALVIDPGTRELSWVETWCIGGSFDRVDWQELASFDADGLEFIRVEGICAPEEAATMAGAVSKLRQKSEAYVVANAVKVSGMADMEDLAGTVEEMQGIDVLNYLFEQLEPEQVTIVKGLLENRDAG